MAKSTDVTLAVGIKRDYDPDLLSDAWTFTRREVANFFFNRSYSWLANIESAGFFIPDNIDYDPRYTEVGYRIYRLKDIDILTTCLIYNKKIKTERAIRIFNLLYDVSENWNRN